MAVFALVDATAFVHGYDFTGDSNKLTLGAEVDDLETTTFGAAGYRSRVGGLKTVAADLAGFWQSATTQAVDPEAFPDLGNVDRACTFSSSGSTETSTAYLALLGKFNYELLGAIGEAAPFTLSMMGTNAVGLVRGQVAKARGNVSATGALGSVVNLGNLSASQYLYATFHTFGTPGTTITVQLQSDTSAGMGTAVTRATIGPVTTATGSWATRFAGPLTAGYYRLNVSGITGTWNAAGAIGIG